MRVRFPISVLPAQVMQIVGRTSSEGHEMATYWDEWLRDRFADRQVLPRDEAKRLFRADLPGELVDEFFDFFELEYSAPAGILRPSDDIRRLTDPISTRNPLRWLAVEPGLEDKASELGYQIGRRTKRFGLSLPAPVQTIGDYVRAWCGHPTTRQDRPRQGNERVPD